MRIDRRRLRKGLVAVGCLVGSVTAPGAVVGVGLIACGSALHLWSKGCLEQNRSLTTAGPYRWTRNPFYLANGLIDSGLCLVIGNPWVALVFLTLWGLSYHDTIAREEEVLAELFAEDYATYRAAVPRLFPNGRGLPRARSRGGFSFGNDGLARGAEYARLLGIALGPCVIVAAEWIRRDGFALFDTGHDGQLAFILALPALWIVKLALAETFRRPDTVLVPWVVPSRIRLVLVGLLALVALTSGLRLAWLAILPGLWCILSLLDHVGDRRGDGVEDRRRPRWRYTPPIVAGSIAAFACVAMLSQ